MGSDLLDSLDVNGLLHEAIKVLVSITFIELGLSNSAQSIDIAVSHVGVLDQSSDDSSCSKTVTDRHV